MSARAASDDGSKAGMSAGEAHRRISITVTLAASIGLLVAIAVVAELLLGFAAGRRNTVSLLNDKSVQIMESIESGVRHHLDPAEDIVGHLQDLVESGLLDPADRVRLSDVLVGALAAAPQVLAVGFWDTALNKVIAVQPAYQPILLIEENVSDQPEFVEILREVRDVDGPVWRELAFDNETTLINVVQAVRRNGVLIGFAGAAVTMPELSQLMADVGDDFGATAFIMHGSDHVLAHPNLVSPHPDLSADAPVVHRSRLGDMALGGMHEFETADQFEEASAEGVQVILTGPSGSRRVVFRREISDYGAIPWTIGVHLPARSLGEEFRRLAGSAAVGVGVLVLSLVAAVALGRGIAKPIKRASAGAVQIAEMDLGRAQPLPSSRIRELNDQADAFNSMLNGLRWFETYVPKTLVRRLIQRAEPLRSEERELTLMFTDIVGFTSLSEALPAAEVAELLNEHFALLGGCVEEEEGTIDKFIGDSVMAFWGAPERQADHAARAIRAARAIAGALERGNADRIAKGAAPVRIRIGLHTGPVVIGNIGAPGRINYTIVGDTVNTGQRIEALARKFDDGAAATVLISAATAAAGGDASSGAELAGAFEVKGRAEPVQVLRLA